MTIYRRPLATLATAAALAVAASACGDDGPGDTTASGDGDRALGTLTIGSTTAQTGVVAPFDQPFLEGFRLCVDEVNEAGEVTLELEVKNGRSDAGATVAAAQELIDGGAGFIITPADGDLSIAAGQVAQRAGIPAISSAASSPGVPTKVGEFMFSNYYGDNAQAYVSANHAVSEGLERAFVLASKDYLYTSELPAYWSEAFEAAGGTVVGEANYTVGQQDFNPLITRIKQLDPAPQVIFTPMFEPDFPAFLKQLRAAGVDSPIYGADVLDTPTVFGLGKVVEGTVYTAAGFNEPGSSTARFFDAYAAAHGKEPDNHFAAVGYDACRVIEAAVVSAGSTEPKAVRDALAELEGVEGATGTITYAGTDRVPMKPVSLARIGVDSQELLVQETPDPAEIPAAK